MFRKKRNEISDSAHIYTRYERLFLVRIKFYIKKDNSVKQHVYPYKLAVKAGNTLLSRGVFAILLFLTMFPLFILGVIAYGERAFNLKEYLKIDYIDELWQLTKGVEDVYNPLQAFKIPVEVPERQYKRFIKECLKVSKINSKNNAGGIADYTLGISILAMENIGIELNEYWENTKKELIDMIEGEN